MRKHLRSFHPNRVKKPPGAPILSERLKKIVPESVSLKSSPTKIFQRTFKLFDKVQSKAILALRKMDKVIQYIKFLNW